MNMKILSTIGLTAFFIAFLLLALLLLGSIIPFFGYQIRIVQSGSMAPTLPMGSALVVRATDTYNVDDIVTFQRYGDAEATTHRIVDSTPDEDEGVMFTMQGDANNVTDQRPVAPREIVGKVEFHIPYLGFVLDFIRQPLGFIIIIGLPALWIFYEQISKIVREVKKETVIPPTENQ